MTGARRAATASSPPFSPIPSTTSTRVVRTSFGACGRGGRLAGVVVSVAARERQAREQHGRGRAPHLRAAGSSSVKAVPTRRVLALSVPVHPLGQLLGDRQAQAGAASRVAGVEAVEDLAVVRQAGPLVGHREERRRRSRAPP